MELGVNSSTFNYDIICRLIFIYFKRFDQFQNVIQENMPNLVSSNLYCTYKMFIVVAGSKKKILAMSNTFR